MAAGLAAATVGGLAQQAWGPPQNTRLGGSAFLRALAESPALAGAVALASRPAARALLGLADWDQARLIAVLGAGAGAITGEVIRRAGRGARILAFEADLTLAARLRAKHEHRADVTVVAGSVASLAGQLNGQQADIIVCGVPLASLRGPTQDEALATVASSLARGGTALFIQYPGAGRGGLDRAFASVQSHVSLASLPPAALYACREPRASVGAAHGQQAPPPAI